MWYVARGNKKQGPLTHEYLLDAVNKRRLLPTDLVWKAGMDKWTPASEVAGLFSPPVTDQNSDTSSKTPPPLPTSLGAQQASPTKKFSLGRIALLSFLIIVVTSIFFSTVGNSNSLTAKILCVLFALVAVAIVGSGHRAGLKISGTVKYYTLLAAFWGLVIGLTVQSEADIQAAVDRLKASDPETYLEMVQEKFGDEKYLAELEKIDPVRFQAEVAARELAAEKEAREKAEADLARMKIDQPQRWLDALEEKLPDQYEEVLKTRQAETQRLLTEVRSVPASESEKNRALYADLVALNPTNETYLKKYRIYSEKASAEKWRADHCTYDRASEVGLYVQPAIKAGLKAPRTAKFPWDLSGTYLGDCRYRYRSWVDAQNGFGAMIRTHYSATLVMTPSGWTLESLDYE